MNKWKWIVTTAYDLTTENEDRARRTAEWLQSPYIKRRKKSIAKLFKETGADFIVAASADELKLHAPGANQPIFFHPSMAQIRVKRLIEGKRDPLIEAAGIVPGDRVIDCTAGAAADSIVISYAVGESGNVTALESEKLLYTIVADGLKHYESDIPEMNAAMRRINMINEDHTQFLSKLPDKSVDVVYFDPMFRHPLQDSAAFEPLRQITNDTPLSEQAIIEAKRVAVKSVLLKEQLSSGEFDRLGFTKRIRKDSKFTFGVIEL